MVRLVFRADALKNLNRLIDCRGLDLDLLEAALEGRVFFDVFAVFVKRGCADALHLATAEGGFNDVRCIHRTFSGTGSDERVEFVDEEDDIFVFANLVHDGLDALFELATVFCAGDHKGEVEGDDTLVAEDFRDIAGNNFLGESLGDGCLADTGLADQNGVVLGAAAENLNNALDLIDAADDGVEFAFAGLLGEVATIGFEGRGFAGGLAAWAGLGGNRIAILIGSEIRIEFLEDFVAGALDVDLEIFQNACRDTFALAEKTQEDVLGAHIGVLQALGFLTRQSEDFLDARCVGDIAHHFGLRAGADLFFDLHAHGLEVEAHFLKDINGNTLSELDQPEKQVFGADIVVIEAVGFLAGEGENLLGAWSEVVHH